MEAEKLLKCNMYSHLHSGNSPFLQLQTVSLYVLSLAIELMLANKVPVTKLTNALQELQEKSPTPHIPKFLIRWA